MFSMLPTLPLLFLACLPESTTMTGSVMDGPDSTTGVADTTVQIRTGDAYPWDKTSADDSGYFEVSLPLSTLFFFEAVADGFVPTVFTGASTGSPMEVVDGELWMRTPEDIDALITEFGDCAAEAAAFGGGVIEGEVRMLVVQTDDVESLPKVTTAALLAYDEGGLPYPACYLDDEGLPAPKAVYTGETGRFAIFGVPSEVISLQIRYDYGGPTEQESWYLLYVPDGGAVPMWPALVSLPGG